jgi:hypothetical protein
MWTLFDCQASNKYFVVIVQKIGMLSLFSFALGGAVLFEDIIINNYL